MRPARPLRRYCPAVILSLLMAAAVADAAVEHRAKSDGISLFKTRLLEPPPLATLSEGDALEMLSQGRSESLVRTEGGLRGWVRNGDIVAVQVAKARAHRIGEQSVVGSDFNHSGIILVPEGGTVRVEELDRSFADEMVETVDREQLEMRNDEN